MADDLKVQVGQQIPGFVDMMSNASAADNFPNVVAALGVLSKMYAEMWKQFALGTPIPGAPRVINMRGGSKYVESIQVLQGSDPMTKEIGADAKGTEAIEKGNEKEIDLKPGLLAGPKHREGKNGPYNIVHFRHGTPKTLSSNNPMPMNIFNMTKKYLQESSKATGTSTDDKGATRQSYEWGGKLPNMSQGQRTKLKTEGGKLKEDYTWKTSPYSGMVRMQDVTSAAKAGGYMTFRTVSRKSDPRSWIIPAKQGVPIRQAVVDMMRQQTEDMVRKAIEKDLSR